MAVGQIASFLVAIVRHDLNLSAAPAFLNTSANADAMYFEPPLAFALGFALFATRPRERWIAGAVLALVGIALLVSFSRASYLAVAVLAAVLVLRTRRPRWRLRAVGALAVVGLIVIELPFVRDRFLTLATSVTNRESIYRQTLQMLSHMPITGAGIDGFATRVAPYRPQGGIIHIYPHDIWLTTWSELGLLGVIAFAVIFFSLLWRAMSAVSTARDIYRPLLWGAAGALILFLVHGFFDSPYWKNDLSVQFWLVAALETVALRSTQVAAADSNRAAAPEPSQVLLDQDTRLGRGRDQREREVERS
jgi:O-antigen ligase